jgi:hypothetical protein
MKNTTEAAVPGDQGKIGNSFLASPQKERLLNFKVNDATLFVAYNTCSMSE